MDRSVDFPQPDGPEMPRIRLGDVEMDAGQGVGLDFVRVEDLGQALEADKGSGRVHRSPCAGRVVPAFIL
jgi:hypothetical protein